MKGKIVLKSGETIGVDGKTEYFKYSTEPSGIKIFRNNGNSITFYPFSSIEFAEEIYPN